MLSFTLSIASSLNKGSECALKSENVIILTAFRCNIEIFSITLVEVCPQIWEP